MADTGRAYFSYLIRAWRGGTDQAGRWRATLDDPHTEERFSFADFEALLAFLRRQTVDRPADDPLAGPQAGQEPGGE